MTQNKTQTDDYERAKRMLAAKWSIPRDEAGRMLNGEVEA